MSITIEELERLALASGVPVYVILDEIINSQLN